MTRYAKPTRLDEALSLLAQGGWTLLAGGTDFYPSLGDEPLRRDVLDINGLDDLRGIETTGDAVTIGARTTWTDILRADLPPAFDALKQAAREVGSVQIQNSGTVAGNLCNASPAADGAPPLLTLDAQVEMRSAAGVRRLPLADFIEGNRKTALRPGELLTAIIVPKAATEGRSAFVKLGARRYLVISIAMVGARIVMDGASRIGSAAIAVGACSPVAKRLTNLEATLAGRRLDEAAGIVQGAQLDELSPIDDVRASADYRGLAVRELVVRAIDASAANDLSGRDAA